MTYFSPAHIPTLCLRGQDSTVFIVVEKPFGSEDLFVVYVDEMPHNLNNEAADRIKFLDSKFNFKKMYIDSTGLGSGVFDFLTVDPSFKYRCVDCQFGSSLDKKPFKEVMYGNLKMLLEKKNKGLPGGLHLPEHKKLLWQLVDLRYEALASGRIKIHHSERGHDDYADALALACLYFKPTEYVQQGSWAIA